MALHILLARQRSGTGALGSLIDQHPEIRYLGELFHPGEIERNNNYFNFFLKKIETNHQRGLPGNNELNYREFMEYVESLEHKKNIFIDVKYSSTHHFNGYWHAPFDIPKFLQLCKRDNRKILHLKRRNYLKTYISGLLAERNKIWHARQEDIIEVRSLVLKPIAVLDYLKTTTRQVNSFDGYLRRYPCILTLEYEDLFQDNGILEVDIAKKMADFLEVEQSPFQTLSPFFVKQAADDLSTIIENFDEISTLLLNTEFAWMLNA